MTPTTVSLKISYLMRSELVIGEAYQSSSCYVSTLTLWLNSSLVGTARGLHIPVIALCKKLQSAHRVEGLLSDAIGRDFSPWELQGSRVNPAATVL